MRLASSPQLAPTAPLSAVERSLIPECAHARSSYRPQRRSQRPKPDLAADPELILVENWLRRGRAAGGGLPNCATRSAPRTLAGPPLIYYHDIMKYNHDSEKSRAKAVREPVQVYLDRPDQDRLERLTEELDTTKSDVLRRGLEALERELFDPEHHPALQIIGIAGVDRGPECDLDVAREHDRYLADLEDRRLSSEP